MSKAAKTTSKQEQANLYEQSWRGFGLHQMRHETRAIAELACRDKPISLSLTLQPLILSQYVLYTVEHAGIIGNIK